MQAENKKRSVCGCVAQRYLQSGYQATTERAAPGTKKLRTVDYMARQVGRSGASSAGLAWRSHRKNDLMVRWHQHLPDVDRSQRQCCNNHSTYNDHGKEYASRRQEPLVMAVAAEAAFMAQWWKLPNNAHI